MVKKVLALAALLLFASTGVAHAGGYTDDDSLTTDKGSYAVGDIATISARTFQAGANVAFVLNSDPIDLGTVVADAAGVASLSIAIPSVPAGLHTITATGLGVDGQTLTVSATITVDGAAAEALPRTGGSSTIPMTQIALGAIVAGGLVVLLANRRRSGTSKPTAHV